MRKWCLNRADQSKHTTQLKENAGMSGEAYLYNDLRPSRILQTEKAVQSIIKVLREEYINPFDPTIDPNQIVNLSSGVSLQHTDVLSCKEIGEKKHQEFVHQRIENKIIPFHSPIKRENLNFFHNNCTKSQSTKKISSVIVNRNIISRLLTISFQSGKQIDFESALQYPLTPVPLSLANPDGSRRVTQKSKLVEVLHQFKTSDEQAKNTKADAYVLDFIAQVRINSKEVPETYEHLALKILHSIPKGYARVDMVADTYRELSIKTAERAKRGDSENILIKSIKSKIPRDFNNFMKNAANKSRLIDLIFDYIANNRSKCLQILRTVKIFLSRDCECKEISLSALLVNRDLSSNQEEADTKVVLHILHILQQSPGYKVHLRSPSADTDILVILLAMIPNGENVLYDSGVGKNRCCFFLSNYFMSQEERNALIGFHAFTGNDYTSSLFGKGKGKCWKLMKSDQQFVSAFQVVGESWDFTDELFRKFEKFVCKLYNSKSDEVNSARFELFQKKYSTQNKVIDLSLLPPCRNSLEKHLARANYVSRIWKCSDVANSDYPPPSHHGWNASYEIDWCGDTLPTDIEDLLLNVTEGDDDDEVYGDDYETDDASDDE